MLVRLILLTGSGGDAIDEDGVSVGSPGVVEDLDETEEERGGVVAAGRDFCVMVGSTAGFTGSGCSLIDDCCFFFDDTERFVSLDVMILEVDL